MIKNTVNFCTEKEIVDNANIMLCDSETLNIFIDGNKTPTMSDTIETIYKNLSIERELYYEFMYEQAIDFLEDIFDLTPMKEIRKINIIISNFERHNCSWMYKNFSLQHKVLEFYVDTAKYFENLVIRVDPQGSCRSFDVYLCKDDFDIEEMKSKVNSPSKYAVLTRILNY